MMSAEEFNELVSSDVRYQDPTSDNPNPVNKITDEQRAWLRDPSMLDRFMDELKAMMRKIDSQLSSHKSEAFRRRLDYLNVGTSGKEDWLKFQVSEASWKAGAIRFKRSVEDRLSEAKRIKRELVPNVPTKLEKVEIVRLRTAIAKHRDAFEDEPSTDDENLWSTLDALS